MPPTLKYQISYRIGLDRRDVEENKREMETKCLNGSSYSSQKVKIGRLGGIKAASVVEGRLDLEIAARKTRI